MGAGADVSRTLQLRCHLTLDPEDDDIDDDRPPGVITAALLHDEWTGVR